MTEYIAAIDQGTTSTRCMLFDHHGQVIISSQKEHSWIYPQPGWVEHDPLEIWECTQDVIRRSLAKGEINPADITAISVTNRRETTNIWDKHTGQPFGKAIVWQDTRAKQICDDLDSEH